MKRGTRSLLFGVHQFIIHPFFVAKAWKILYGFPKSFPLWVAIIVHDFGYFGKPNMDGPEGETHPELGGRIMTYLFGEEWGNFTLCHSRHYSRLRNQNFSQLCVADKLASMIYPRWLYIILARLSGEMMEYRHGDTSREAYAWSQLRENATTDAKWFDAFCTYMMKWVEENKLNGDPPPTRISSIRSKPDVSAQSNQSDNSLENSRQLP